MPFEDNYPNIDRWVSEHQGWIEIGYHVDSPLNSFIRALDAGGMPWEGRNSYPSIDAALEDLDHNLAIILDNLYGD